MCVHAYVHCILCVDDFHTICNLLAHVVIRIEDASDVLCQVAIQHSLNVVPVVDWVRGVRGDEGGVRSEG